MLETIDPSVISEAKRSSPSFPLDPGDDEARQLLHTISEAAIDALKEMTTSPASAHLSASPTFSSPLFQRAPDEKPGDLSKLLETIREAGRIGINTANGRALAYMPGSGLASAAGADLMAGIINAYTGVSMTAPAMVAMERSVIRWMADLAMLPPTAGGITSSGGSMSTMSALLCAKTALKVSQNERGRIYVTAETHHCVAKAACLLGFPTEAICQVPTDERLRMVPEALRAMVAADRALNLEPFCIVGNAGTTSTGAVDPLLELSTLAKETGLWLHVDAAYGGFFYLTERGRASLAGLSHADSIVLDPHKSLFLPYGTGVLLVRDEAILRRAHSVEGGAYLRDLDDIGGDFADISPELSRPNRGLRLWLPLHLHGIAAFRTALDEKLDLAEEVRSSLDAMEGISVHPGSDLSIVAFRCHADTVEVGDRKTDDLARRVNASGEIFLATTRLGGRVYVRIAVLGLRTSAAIIERALALIYEASQLNLRGAAA